MKAWLRFADLKMYHTSTSWLDLHLFPKRKSYPTALQISVATCIQIAEILISPRAIYLIDTMLLDSLPKTAGASLDAEMTDHR